VAKAGTDRAAMAYAADHRIDSYQLFSGSSKLGTVHGSASRILLYGGTVITQLVLILLVWFGIRLRGVRMRDLIGGRGKGGRLPA